MKAKTDLTPEAKASLKKLWDDRKKEGIKEAIAWYGKYWQGFYPRNARTFHYTAEEIDLYIQIPQLEWQAKLKEWGIE